MEGLAYDGTDQAIGHGRYVEDDGLQFIVVDFAISQDRFISLLSYDFAYEDARIVIIAGTFTFQSDRKFFDNWGIDVMALVDMAAGLFDFVHLIARFYAKVIGNVDGILGGKGDSKSLGVLDVVRRLVFGQKERDFAVIRLRSPGSIHGIRHGQKKSFLRLSYTTKLASCVRILARRAFIADNETEKPLG